MQTRPAQALDQDTDRNYTWQAGIIKPQFLDPIDDTYKPTPLPNFTFGKKVWLRIVRPKEVNKAVEFFSEQTLKHIRPTYPTQFVAKQGFQTYPIRIVAAVFELLSEFAEEGEIEPIDFNLWLIDCAGGNDGSQ